VTGSLPHTTTTMMLYELTTTPTPSTPTASPTASPTATEVLLEEQEAVTDNTVEAETETDPPTEEQTEDSLVQTNHFLTKAQTFKSFAEVGWEAQTVVSADEQTTFSAVDDLSTESEMKARTSPSVIETQSTGSSLKVLTLQSTRTAQTTGSPLNAQTVQSFSEVSETTQYSLENTEHSIVTQTPEGEEDRVEEESTMVSERMTSG